MMITFKKGAVQAKLAADYFQEEGGELLRTYLKGMAMTNYLVQKNRKQDMAMRLWISGDRPWFPLQGCVELIDRMEEWIGWVREESPSVNVVQALLEEMPHPPEDAGSEVIFLEHLQRAGAFTSYEKVDLVMGIVAGEVVLVSMDGFMYVRMEKDLVGITVQARGSYLVDNVREPLRRSDRRYETAR